jgi:radical SAM-linked protein
VARIWERALRRARLPIAYTEGFSPRPKLSFGLALSTGYESLGEYLDVNLREDGPVEVEQLPALLTPALPVGMEVQAVIDLEPGTPSLQQAVTSCTWHIELDETEARVAALVARALSASELVIARTRKGREADEDVRSGIVSLRVLGPAPSDEDPAIGARPQRSGRRADAGRTVVEAELATQPRGLRPAELVRALDPALELRRVVRTHQWTHVGGARQEVIPHLPAATPTRTPEARAS